MWVRVLLIFHDYSSKPMFKRYFPSQSHLKEHRPQRGGITLSPTLAYSTMHTIYCDVNSNNFKTEKNNFILHFTEYAIIYLFWVLD